MVKYQLINNFLKIIMSSSESQKRICSGICKKFIVKKPAGSRYGSGQGRCQICQVWIDHNGARLKDGSPAIENSLGWWCVCCNYRIRQRPRNRIYKEKIREKKESE
ncbi:MAG: hypothetical protein ACKO7N_01525 [Candidatus Nitrosotenuis sp.]